MRTSALLLATFATFVGLACSSISVLERPYLVIRFSNIELFVEGETSVDSIELQKNNSLRFAQEGSSNYRFRAEGDGVFEIRDHSCSLEDASLMCDEIDMIRLSGNFGGVIIRLSGEFVPVNPLTVLAR